MAIFRAMCFVHAYKKFFFITALNNYFLLNVVRTLQDSFVFGIGPKVDLCPQAMTELRPAIQGSKDTAVQAYIDIL
jgi:hypothetical protein